VYHQQAGDEEVPEGEGQGVSRQRLEDLLPVLDRVRV
jgi:hypothetical protein